MMVFSYISENKITLFNNNECMEKTPQSMTCDLCRIDYAYEIICMRLKSRGNVTKGTRCLWLYSLPKSNLN